MTEDYDFLAVFQNRKRSIKMRCEKIKKKLMQRDKSHFGISQRSF